MSRYIDADALINRFDELCDSICQYSKKQRNVMCGACPLGSAFDVVDDFPTADVKPVVRGEWIHEESQPDLWECSKCHWLIDGAYICPTNYCPN